MFDNIEKCLNECKEVYKKVQENPEYVLTEEEVKIVNYFDLHLSEAIMNDFRNHDKGERVAKIILAALGLSNEIKLRIE